MSELQLTTQELQASYGIGLQMGEQLKAQPFEGLDISAVAAGIADAFGTELVGHSPIGYVHAAPDLHALVVAALLGPEYAGTLPPCAAVSQAGWAGSQQSQNTPSTLTSLVM